MNNINLLLIVVIVFLFICVTVYFIVKGKKNIILEEDYSTFNDILTGFKTYIVEITKDDFDGLMSDEEYRKRKSRKIKTNESLKNAKYGVVSAKEDVKGIIRGFLVDNVPVERLIQILGLDNESQPTHHTIFEILMYRFKKVYGKRALSKWIVKYDLHRMRAANGFCKKGDEAYYITKKDLEDSYFIENIKLSVEEIFDVFTVLLYQAFIGFGMIDTILEMNINGVNIGCSGSVMDSVQITGENINTEIISEATNALWLHYHGTYVHMQFLDFGSEDEIRRIIQLLIRYNSPGPLSAKKGYLINTMHDKSRILAVRPPAAEYWAAFIRKFTLENNTPEYLILKNGINNGEMCLKLIEFLMRGLVTIGVTGRAGSGKTTLLKAIISYYKPIYNIGVLEMAPEMYLREIYPDRNIISLQETDYVSTEEEQDAIKKGDRAISIIGEIATSPVAARMVQLAMTSIATLFTHHANTAKDLVLTLRNSLVEAGGFNNMTTAEKQVTDAVKWNIHMEFTPEGLRYVKRITEIVQLDGGIPYPEYDPDNKDDSLAEIRREYYTRQTDRVSFITRDILTFDLDTNTYVIGEEMSIEMYNKILETLSSNEKKDFKQFISYYWKDISIDGYKGVTDINYANADADKGKEKLMPKGSYEDFTDAINFLIGRDNSTVSDYGFGELITNDK